MSGIQTLIVQLYTLYEALTVHVDVAYAGRLLAKRAAAIGDDHGAAAINQLAFVWLLAIAWEVTQVVMTVGVSNTDDPLEGVEQGFRREEPSAVMGIDAMTVKCWFLRG